MRMMKELLESIWANAGTLFVITLILAAAFLASNLLGRFLSWYQMRAEAAGSRTLTLSITSFASKSLNLVIFSIAFITILAYLNISITPLLAGLGIAGIAVALASQDLFSNFFGAIAIFIDRPFKLGDRVKLSSGEYGDIVEIGIRSTRLKTLDNRVVVLPNASIASANINNYSLPDSRIRHTLRFSIEYGSDVEKATKILTDVASGMYGVLKEPAPAVYVEELGKYGINLVLLVWVENLRRDSDVPGWIYEQAVKSFASEGINMPYPTKDIRYQTISD
ncbi:mechanosensitive ion channel family protein [Methanocella arvoryzae]|nr:mechanosensitive ion channel family protein [Methanocella arvoryzae]